MSGFFIAQTSLGDGTLSVQTEMDYPQDGNSLATFDESYTQTMLLDSGSTTNSSFAVQTVGEVTTVSVGPITETGTSSFAYAATGTSTFHSSQPGIYTAAVPTTDPNSGDPPTDPPAPSPFEGLPTLTIIDSSETWTDALSITNQSAYDQTINLNPDDTVSLDRTETGSSDSSYDQTLISTLTINDEVGSIDDGLGTAFTFSETSNLHSWNDGESSYAETLSLISTAPTDPAETPPPDGETIPADNTDITISLTHNETGTTSSGLDLETTGSQSYQLIGITETVVGTTSPTDGTPPVTTTEPVAFELVTSDTWLSTLGIVATMAYTTGLTYSTEDGFTLDVSETGQSHSTLNSESSSSFNLSTETTHADQTATTALYQVQSTLAYSLNANEQYTLQSDLSFSSDDEITTSGTLVESGDGITNGTTTATGSHETSTVQPATDPNDMPLVLQTSNDIWTDQLTFNDLYEFDRTTVLSADSSQTIIYEQSGSGASAFDHAGSGSSDDADEATPTETYQHHIWENSDHSYTFSAIIVSAPADSESTSSDSTDPQENTANTEDTGQSGNVLVSPEAQITDFSYVSTSHKVGGIDANGTSDFAKSLIGTLPITGAETLANAPTITSTPWDDTTTVQHGMEFLVENDAEGDQAGAQFVAAPVKKPNSPSRSSTFPDTAVQKEIRDALEKSGIEDLPYIEDDGWTGRNGFDCDDYAHLGMLYLQREFPDARIELMSIKWRWDDSNKRARHALLFFEYEGEAFLVDPFSGDVVKVLVGLDGEWNMQEALDKYNNLPGWPGHETTITGRYSSREEYEKKKPWEPRSDSTPLEVRLDVLKRLRRAGHKIDPYTGDSIDAAIESIEEQILQPKSPPPHDFQIPIMF